MNLTFLNPLYLWALPVVLGPLLIHLFTRKNPRIVEYSNIKYLKLAIERVQNKYRLRKLLLLIIRTLIILLVILYFLRPVIRYGQGKDKEKDSKSVSVVILTDVSYSMSYIERGKPRFKDALDTARKIVSMLSPSDRIAMVSYSDRIESATPGLVNDKNYLLEAIDKTKQSYHTTNFKTAWDFALKLLNESASTNKAVFILSDMAENEFKEPIKGDENIKVFAFKTDESENIYINDVKLDYNVSGNNWYIETTGINTYTSNDKKVWPVSYFENSNLIADGFIKTDESSKFINYISYPSESDLVSGKTVLLEDNLPVDNVFYWSKRQGTKADIWIIDGDPKFGGVTSESFYVKNALPRAKVLTESELNRIDYSKEGVLILLNTRTNDEKIKNYIASGQNALIFLADLYQDKYKQDYFPCTIGNKFYTLESVLWSEVNHPLGKLFDNEKFEWQNIEVSEGYVLQPKEDAFVLAKLSSGWPFLVESRYGNGKVILCPTSADRSWNNLASKPVFVPLINELVKYLSSSNNIMINLNLHIGETFRYPSDKNSNIITPDNEVLKPLKDNDDIVFTETHKPGIYTLMSNGVMKTRFAVNLDVLSGESAINKVYKEKDLKKYFKDNILIMLDRDNWESVFLAMVAGKDIGEYILFALLLLILFEVLLANPLIKRG